MAVMSEDVKGLFELVSNVVFSTATTNAQPNSCIVAMKKVIDDDTVYLSDQFFRKTLSNVLENEKVAIVFWEGQNAYQIHGTARYVNEGAEFEEQASWVNAAFEGMGLPFTAKGGVFVHVDAVFSSAAGPTAGERVA